MAAEWDVSMTTGVPQVDDEHKELFRQVANLNQAMCQGKGRDEIGKLLDFVGNYVVKHFAHEEKYMDDYRCPIAAANKTAHKQFIAKFKELRNRFENIGTTSALTIEINDTLRTWLVEHILQIDAQLLACTKTAKKEPALVMCK